MVRQRVASPYEKRLAIREDLGYFNSAAVGGVYEFDNGEFEVKLAHSYMPALKSCIETYPQMMMVMKGKDTNEPLWEVVPHLNLADHVSILTEQAIEDEGEAAVIEKVLPSIVDQKFTDPSSPPWRLVVLPFLSTSNPRCFIAYVSSHATADGGSGCVFHRTFMSALRKFAAVQLDDTVIKASEASLPEPFDTPERLPISPEFMKSLASANVVDGNTWTGSPVFLGPEGLQTGLRIIEIGNSQVKSALAASRVHGTKLTGLFHQLVVRALSKAIPVENGTNFASQTAIDMRAANGSTLAWGNFVSGLSHSHQRTDSSKPISDETWANARVISDKLAECSLRLEDQMIGMIRFVPDHRASMTQKLGKSRDASFALSNLNAFDGVTEGGVCKISKFLMATSAAVPSATLSFCIASVKDGNLTCVVTWQKGALGCLPEQEHTLLDVICSSIKEDFESLAA
ncbi:conserved hypothetical protein [Talaromyces stipitatus ATCC 10500]|uniref:Alcohol acetyltransferase n=1 Tax=Talaromyces stipitatus (strain ATCC 10500 / CBS 375.48 / QM 6759 / NRRL 1006) TaxID=441959 RepID=B8MEK9_TALSN|nr:uncharacterized protein TSTA_017110 [Talaromyces stipitatus ATCC 10500]EED16636.1 conserved hypothetical protein [Talaromyces stipitatus ATCC 10500]